MQQTSTEEVKEVPFDDQTNVVGSWEFRELKSIVGFAEGVQNVWEGKEVMEQ